MNNIQSTYPIPYYAVIFSSERTEGDRGYHSMAEKMVELAQKQNGFLGIESAKDNAIGLTVSYWRTLEDIATWKNNAAHQIAQDRGKSEWYSKFTLRICKVERDYTFDMTNDE